MRLYPAQVINFTSTLLLDLPHKTVELIPDDAKPRVWQKDFDALRNQYRIAPRQFQMLSLLAVPGTLRQGVLSPEHLQRG